MILKHLREEHPELLDAYRQLKAKIARDERKAKRMEQQIDGLRSILSYLKPENEAVR